MGTRTTKAVAAKRAKASAPKVTRTKPQSDAIALLRADHREVEQLFTEFERLGPTAYASKRKLVDQMVIHLSQHAAIEEAILYPAVRGEVPSSTDEILEALEEHHVVKWELQELIGSDPSDERFDAKVSVMSENVRHHVREEEGELFPLLRTHLGRKRLLELGNALNLAKRKAPKRPHPRFPDEPLWESPAGSHFGSHGQGP